MRNKYLLIFSLILLSNGCAKDEDPKIILNLSGGELSGQYQASSQTVSFNTNKSWTATVADTKASSWISVHPASGNAGDITLYVDMLANTMYLSREAVVTVTAGSLTSTFRVRQEASPPTVTIDKNSQGIGSDAGTATVAVSTNGAPWSITGLPSWMTASSSTGTTATTVVFTYQANILAIAREANIVFTSLTATKTHTITQTAAPATIAIDLSTKTVESTSGNFTLAVTTNSASWKASGIPEWVALNPSESTGSGSVVLNYSQNTTNSLREATITFTAGSAVKTLKVTQLRTGGYIDGGDL